MTYDWNPGHLDLSPDHLAWLEYVEREATAGWQAYLDGLPCLPPSDCDVPGRQARWKEPRP